MNPRRLDLKGQQIHWLTVLAPAGKNKHGQTLWACRCVCSANKILSTNVLRSGNVKSCGCKKREFMRRMHAEGRIHHETHGDTGSIEYLSWSSMLERCKPTSKDHFGYFDRGIMVCPRWNSYVNFLSDMGRRPADKCSLDRIDNAKGYEPGNCRWASRIDQQRNRRGNRLLTYGGETLPLVVWCERLGLPWRTLHSRAKRGWSDEDVLTKPIISKRH